MNKWNRIITILCVGMIALTAVAQRAVDTQVHIFDNNVRSLKVCLANNMYIPPILMMGGDQRLQRRRAQHHV